VAVGGAALGGGVRGAPDERALGGARVVLATEVAEMRRDDVLAAPNPWRAAINARDERRAGLSPCYVAGPWGGRPRHDLLTFSPSVVGRGFTTQR
jgi:hypothetical protein